MTIIPFRRRGPKRHVWPAEHRRHRTFALLTVACFLIGAAATTAYMRYPGMAEAAIAYVQSASEGRAATPDPSARTRAFLRGEDVRIIDGDTVRLRGEAQSIRLVGFNTGETSSSRAECPAEVEAAKMARARLREIVNSGTPSVTKVPCACRPGTEGTKACNYGRACGVLRVDGRDVADVLISEGLAAPYVCGATGCPRPPKPWC